MADLKLKLPTPYEPKKKNRWLVRFKNLDIELFHLQTASRPKFIKKGYWIWKRWEVEPMTFEIVDPIASNMVQDIYSQLISDSTIDLDLELLDPVGTEIEKWKINGAEIIECDFGNLSYSKDELLMVKLTIKPKKAILVF